MRSLLSSLAAAALLATLLPMYAAYAADDIGAAITVNNVVTAELDRDKRRLSEGDPVRQNELIEVGEDSLGELKFKDETKLALGAGSRVVLDKYVYDPNKTAGSIVMNLVRGTFRFITGVAAKPTYQIKTPHASISVRGTIFDVYVRDDGAAWLLLIEGSVRVCNDRGICRVLDEPGKIIRIDDEGNIAKPAPWKSLPGKRDIKFENAYPFFSRPTRISREIPDFTDEIVSVGTIPPVFYWPTHPRRPRWPAGTGPYPGDGKWPGGKWPGGKWPGDGKHPGDGKYPGDKVPGGKWPGGKGPIDTKTPGDGKTPYPGRDTTGKGTTAGTAGKGTTTGTKTGKLDGPAILQRLKEGKLKTGRKSGDAVTVYKKSVEVKSSRIKRTEKVVRSKSPVVKHAKVKHSTARHTTVKASRVKASAPKMRSFKSSGMKTGGFKSSSFKMSTGKSFGGGFGGRRR